ncbi:MAG: heavy metal translocating P-type ATPase [Candidatus Limnocylindrales bacterium]
MTPATAVGVPARPHARLDVVVSRIVSRLLLPFTTACLAGGVVAQLAGASALGDGLWIASSVVSAMVLLVAIVDDLRRGKTGVDVVAFLAMAGSVALGQLLAGAVIAVMYATGGALERYAQGRAERELSALLARSPGVAHRREADGLADRPVEAVRQGDLLLVKPGDVVPVDGVIVGQPATLDESALTGESRVVVRDQDEPVSSGVVNAGGGFDMRATATAEASTYAGIIRLVREAQASKSPFVRLTDRYALWFVVGSLGMAGLAWLVSGDAVRGLAVLVVATPCPLLLAVPIAIVAGISRAARRGIIVKGGGALEALADARVLLMDKTGTMTTGRASLARVDAAPGGDGDLVLALAASLDQVSPHVLAGAIVHAAHQRGLLLTDPERVIEAQGAGIRGRVGAHEVVLGSRDWVLPGGGLPEWAVAAQERVAGEGGMTVHVGIDGSLAGILALEDPIRGEAPRALRLARRAGIRRIVMVTGDQPAIAEIVGAALGVDAVLAERTPGEKVEAVAAERINAPGGTVMIGDGINDAPALAAADVGVAMGARGATASSEAADVVITVDRLDRLAEAILIGRRARRIATQSVVVGMALSGVAMVAAAFGLLPPVQGALLQEGIDVLVILNALRALTGERSRVPRVAGWEHTRSRLEAEHAELRPLIASVRSTADDLDHLGPATARASLLALSDRLGEELLRHEQAEEATIYPQLAAAIGGEDPLAVLSGSHREIFHLVRLLRHLSEVMAPDGPDAGQLRDARRVLYGLHAILQLHDDQEAELYRAVAAA